MVIEELENLQSMKRIMSWPENSIDAHSHSAGSGFWYRKSNTSLSVSFLLISVPSVMTHPNEYNVPNNAHTSRRDSIAW